jgi:hypothetical protein
MGRPSLLMIIYLVIGVLVAAARDYFANIDNVRGIASAALAIVLWPLVLLGVDLDLGREGEGKKSVLLPAAWIWIRQTLLGRAR